MQVHDMVLYRMMHAGSFLSKILLSKLRGKCGIFNNTWSSMFWHSLRHLWDEPCDGSLMVVDGLVTEFGFSLSRLLISLFSINIFHFIPSPGDCDSSSLAIMSSHSLAFFPIPGEYQAR